ncbi:hydantoinase/oxoprolinase family protein [Siminovitchia acidinfaciens]|uniref:Hydantoinase/oxoprolinase family protein n=1 Tax=Siminovitchia acidinfaciens TaxID=2321395 RepID=A0A429Y6V8_9BACI|nr:hydantoinase/oxoprolinase family protein [Siminovitchia acidinfaciens]RST77189.1 hydantoinase/oxoprolinase family protein [Siminovitchia acidinfaciens]
MGIFTIGIDVGGTFTDFLVLNTKDQTQLIDKVPTTPSDPSIGVLNGLNSVSNKLGMDTKKLLNKTKLIVHGTTVTTNAVLTGTGAKTGLITTEGFRDMLQMRRGIRSREHLYNNKYTAPPALINRDLVVGISERTDLNGKVIKEVKEEEVREAVEWFEEQQVQSVAICFMHSYANPDNEIQVKRLVQEMMPDAFVTISTDVSPVMRLNNRVGTVAMNAYVGPVLNSYIDRLLDKLRNSGFDNGELLIMQSSGGVTNPQTVSRVPASTVLSGPAAGPVSGKAFAKASGYENAIVIDMGGTSFEASIVQDGEISIKKEGEINRNLISLPMASIHSIGSGGGSIAWIDKGGLLQVGPQSAGATPGPVCYDKGGEKPTCSDANLILGYLSPSFFLGGKMQLDSALTRNAIREHIADPLNKSVEEAAFGIYQISNLNMANGVKEVTVQNGYDPRDFPLVVAGGAGPIHAAMIARELNISEVIIPIFSSVLCAVGMLASNLRHDYVRSYQKVWEDASFGEVIDRLKNDRIEGTNALITEGIEEEDHIVMVGLDMRYRGQHYEVTIEVPEELIRTNRKKEVEKLFHDEHERLYGYNLEGHEIEVINVRLSCRGSFAEFEPKKLETVNGAEGIDPKNYREVYDPVLKEFINTPVFDGDRMKAGTSVQGPAIIELTTTTIVVPSQFNITMEKYGNFLMRDTASKSNGKKEETVDGSNLSISYL